MATAAQAIEDSLAVLESVPDQPGIRTVAEVIGSAEVVVDAGTTGLDLAEAELGEVRQRVERTETPVLSARLTALSDNLRTLRAALAAANSTMTVEQQAALNVGTIEADGPKKPDLKGTAKGKELRQPNQRHLLDRINTRSKFRDKNTIVLPWVDVAADIDAIQEGRARWDSGTSRYTTPTGRSYAVKDNGTVFPEAGPGFVLLDRFEYQALQHYIQAGGDRVQAESAMRRNPRLTEPVRRRAFEVFKYHNSFRGE